MTIVFHHQQILLLRFALMLGSFAWLPLLLHCVGGGGAVSATLGSPHTHSPPKFEITNPWILDQRHGEYNSLRNARLSKFQCSQNLKVCKSKWLFGEGGTCCGGVCKDTLHDPENCGECGNVCHHTCTCCLGDCVNLNLDTHNCGSCGHRCDCQSRCEFGMCGYADTPPPSDKCGICLPTQTCCSDTGKCVDLNEDNDNCGACGNQCSDGKSCTSGECVAQCGICLPTQTCCSDTGECVDLNEDDDNCGACGNQCSDGKTCTSGACVVQCGICLPTQTCCSDTGNCVDLNEDDDNCGECGKQCSDGETCTSGACVAQCPTPRTGDHKL